MRRFFIAANWKMNGNAVANTELISQILVGLSSGSVSSLNFDVMIAVPFVYIAQLKALTELSAIQVAAQNVSEFENGAYTGEVSASMLSDMQCDFALVGHSERRQLFHETNEQVALKFLQLQKNNVHPILCVGETLEQREAGQTEWVVSEQLSAVINTVGVDALNNSVLAYEPVWAIGTGKTASPEQAQAVHKFLRSDIAKHSTHVANSIQIVYGGSVNEETAQALFEQEDIDGGLIGGASLKADSFLNICKVVDRG
jgi:triosephosphate isomerase